MSFVCSKSLLLRNLLRCTIINNPKRFNSSNSCPAVMKLTYSEFGDPVKVIDKISDDLRDPHDSEVLVKMLAAPVNPADINTIQGKYPVKTVLPAVPGNEGVAEVVKVGQSVTDLCPGDHVVPFKSNLGTWRTHLLLTKNDVMKVPKELGLVEAATLTVNPCTAYRMLKDFTILEAGDTVLQNGANSACGQNVIQLCSAWGINTVNVVRSRPNLDELKNFLHRLGATHVITEEELRTTDIFKSGRLKKPKLALNCVGGQNALNCLRHLQEGSPMVTYGGMSREPVTVPTSALIFKDLEFRGFWMTRWSHVHANSPERLKMLEELTTMMINNQLQGPAYKMIEFDNYKEALQNTMTIQGMIGKKFILEFK